MPSKRILILANSIRLECHCVAGREIVYRGRQYSLGRWIRPVSNHGKGELSDEEIALDVGTPAKVMNFVEIPLGKNVGDPVQSENWRIADGQKWKDCTDEHCKPAIDSLVENPAAIWLDRRQQRSDRIPHSRFLQRAPRQSLYVIRPEQLHFEAYSEESKHDGRNRRRTRAVFRYNDVDYDLPMTDPVAADKYFQNVPPPGKPPMKIVPISAAGCLLVVSLTPEYHGYHYKIVASVIEG